MRQPKSIVYVQHQLPATTRYSNSNQLNNGIDIRQTGLVYVKSIDDISSSNQRTWAFRYSVRFIINILGAIFLFSKK